MIKNFTLGKMLIMIFISVSSTVRAANSHSGLSLLGFRAAQITAFQTDGSLYSGFVGWTPSFRINHDFGVRLSLGGILSKSKVGDKYPIIDAKVLAAYTLSNQLAIEAGGGKQIFIGNGGARWALTTNIAYHTDLFIFDHLYFGYTAAMVPTNLTHEFRLGVGTLF